jgi:hypothetical protein
MLKLHGVYIIHNKISKKLVISTSELIFDSVLANPAVHATGATPTDSTFRSSQKVIRNRTVISHPRGLVQLFLLWISWIFQISRMPWTDTVSERRITGCRITKCQISERRITECYLTGLRKLTNVQLANGELANIILANVESY